MTRLLGIVATLWFFFTVSSLLIALMFSPMGLRLLLPDSHPVSWVYPTLLVGPPLALLAHHFVSARFSKILLWTFAIPLALGAVVLFGGLGSFFFAR